MDTPAISTPKVKEYTETYTFEEALQASIKYFGGDDLAANVWVNKYPLKDSYGHIYERTPDDMHRRLARAIDRYLKPGTRGVGQVEEQAAEEYTWTMSTVTMRVVDDK